MRRALNINPSVARLESHPAPTGGWNARDNIGAMKVDEAFTLDNWFPNESRCVLRNGYEDYCDTGEGLPVETLMSYSFGSTNTLFAVSGGDVADVSTDPDNPAYPWSFSNSRIQYVNFGTVGGNFLIAVTGEDDPASFDGSSWDNPALAGISDPTKLIHVNIFKRRLFFIEKDTLSFWYLPTQNIAGTLAEFDLASIFPRGGYLMAMGTWTRDSGIGIDDFAVFVTSKGEVAIYEGTDPSDADFWALRGVFHIGAPIGRRCMFKVGSDLVVITQDGFVPLSRELQADRTSRRIALSDKISGAVSAATRAHGAKFGWQCILYPRGNYALFNVPILEGEKQEQYVANTTTNAWCRFTGMNASCWEVFNEELYFGGNDGIVYKADTGQSDNGANISADVQTAFDYFGAANKLKRFTMVAPVLNSSGNINAAIAVNVDFSTNEPTSMPSFSSTGGSPWDTSPWDTSPWTSDAVVKKGWQTVQGVGYCASLRMRIVANEFSVAWNSINWMYEPGGYL